MSRIVGVVVGAVLLLAVAACDPGDDSGSAPPPSTTAAAAPAQGPAPDNPDTYQRICRVTEGGGSYYLSLSSATEHNFSACDGRPTVKNDLDALLALPGMDRRCFLDDPASIEHWGASIAVYSDTKKADLAAEKARCQQEHGHTN